VGQLGALFPGRPVLEVVDQRAELSHVVTFGERQ